MAAAALISTGADEICDGLDNDCDSHIDDADDDVDEDSGTTFYADLDGDGVGDSDVSLQACAQPTGASSLDGDCDDLDPLNFEQSSLFLS